MVGFLAIGCDQRPVLEATHPEPEVRSVAALLLDVGAGAPDARQSEELLFAGEPSLRSVVREVSLGRLDLDIDVFGPYSLDEPRCLPSESGGPNPAQPNGARVLEIIDALPQRYDHYLWLYDESAESEDCQTWGDQGSPDFPAAFASFTRHGAISYAHELGHNLGMVHEPMLDCPSAVPLDDAAELCTAREYGNTLSFMGLGRGHPSAYQKAQLGWLRGCDGVRAQGSMCLRLLPVEMRGQGVRLLQVPAPKKRTIPASTTSACDEIGLDFYYLELRVPDESEAVSEAMVFVSLGPDLFDAGCGVAPYALDQRPERGAVPTMNNGGLRRGERYEDPAGGMSIEVLELDDTGATVSIVTTESGGEPLCLDGTAFNPTTSTSCRPSDF